MAQAHSHTDTLKHTHKCKTERDTVLKIIGKLCNSNFYFYRKNEMMCPWVAKITEQKTKYLAKSWVFRNKPFTPSLHSSHFHSLHIQPD